MLAKPFYTRTAAIFLFAATLSTSSAQGAPAPTGGPSLDLASCLSTLRPAAAGNGVSVADFDRYTQGASLLATTVASAKAQPEGQETWWDYIAKTVDNERIAEGKQVLNTWRAPLSEIDDRYQVDGETLVAIFGIETNFGSLLGRTRVLDAWLTRACTESNPLWKKNVYASLRLLADGTVAPDSFTGSWSGAFGMTQFIPTSFYEMAADGDGDGKVDLYHSTPDALASTANHLKKRQAKWARGLPAVIEVKLPAALAAGIPAAPDAQYANASDSRAIAQWAAAGVVRVDGTRLDAIRDAGSARAYLFAPTGSGGPIFLATQNFDAIRHYNRSYKYTLAVSLLINGLKGEPGIRTPWPTDDPGLSRLEIKTLQGKLAQLGYDVGTPDGIPGLKTREAVAQEQGKRGINQDGRVGRKIYDVLQTP